MAPRLDPNLSLLWASEPLAARVEHAHRAGFTAFELWWPGDDDAARLPELTKRHGLTLAALNFDAGDMPAGDRGLLADPERTEQFRANVPHALEIAAACGCQQLNALVGQRDDRYELAEQLDAARGQLTFAAAEAARQDAVVLVEAVNSHENGPYLVAEIDDAAALAASVAQPNVRLLFDAYHVSRMGTDVLGALDRHFDLVAHVQVADDPGRHEPGTGAIDYAAFFADLDRRGYQGYVGLEYRPGGHTVEEGLEWIEALGLSRA